MTYQLTDINYRNHHGSAGSFLFYEGPNGPKAAERIIEEMC